MLILLFLAQLAFSQTAISVPVASNNSGGGGASSSGSSGAIQTSNGSGGFSAGGQATITSSAGASDYAVKVSSQDATTTMFAVQGNGYIVTGGNQLNNTTSDFQINGANGGALEIGNTMGNSAQVYFNTNSTGGKVHLRDLIYIDGNSAPTNDQALCIHSGQLGHCTSAVGVGGACTCSAP